MESRYVSIGIRAILDQKNCTVDLLWKGYPSQYLKFGPNLAIVFDLAVNIADLGEC